MLINRYSGKILPLEALIQKVGTRRQTHVPRPAWDSTIARERRVVLAHGVFDVIHPGHIHHLLQAKDKADILVVSLTSDRFCNKALNRPYMPQDMRALNLSAYEMVDYVLIDDHRTPLELLEALKPDFYAKGFEYATDNRPQFRAIPEVDLVTGYGGEVIYTSGDFVRSSSAIIKADTLDIRGEKLRFLMAANKITFDDCLRALANGQEYRVHVVGDLIVDSITYCSVLGGLIKTPTVSMLYERKQDFVGGAGVTAKHFQGAGLQVWLSTVIGDDKLGEFALKDLEASGVNMNHLVDRANRPTTNKNAIVDIASGYRLLKIDTLDSRSISDYLTAELCKEISRGKHHAVVFSDFRHGIFNRRTIPQLIEAIPTGTFKAVDSQVASRWGNITEFKGFDLITPNEREARFSLGNQDSGIRALASELFDEAQTKLLLMKLGKDGIIACRSPDHESSDSYFVIDSFANNVVDPVGAGDAFLAYSVLGMLTSGSTVISAILGTLAAAVECEQDGNIPVTVSQVRSKLLDVEEQLK